MMCRNVQECAEVCRSAQKRAGVIFISSTAGMVQISNSTNMILDMQGGFKTEERGGLEVKVIYQ